MLGFRFVIFSLVDKFNSIVCPLIKVWLLYSNYLVLGLKSSYDLCVMLKLILIFSHLELWYRCLISGHYETGKICW